MVTSPCFSEAYKCPSRHWIGPISKISSAPLSHQAAATEVRRWGTMVSAGGAEVIVSAMPLGVCTQMAVVVVAHITINPAEAGRPSLHTTSSANHSTRRRLRLPSSNSSHGSPRPLGIRTLAWGSRRRRRRRRSGVLRECRPGRTVLVAGPIGSLSPPEGASTAEAVGVVVEATILEGSVGACGSGVGRFETSLGAVGTRSNDVDPSQRY